MGYILGINELLHDTSAVLLKDGKVVGAIEEERLSGEKHALGLCLMGKPPSYSVDWCLGYFGLDESQIDAVAVSFDVNTLTMMKMLYNVITEAIQKMSVKNAFKQKSKNDPGMNIIPGSTYGFFVRRRAYFSELRRRFKEVVFVKHHLAHAASAYYCSAFDRANIFVTDGVGDESPTSLYYGRDGELIPIKQFHPHQSLGTLYRTVSQVCGFVYFDAGKTMGLSAYGTPRPELGEYLRVYPYSYSIDFKPLRKLWKFARDDGQPIAGIHKDIAATLQERLEAAGMEMTKLLHAKTGCRNLCLGGGVSLNCVMNSALLNSEFVDDIFIQPAAMDMGAALGAAVWVAHLKGESRPDAMEDVFLGPEYSNDEIKTVLDATPGIEFRHYERIEQPVAKLLADNKTVGWFQGRMEFGPRALGSRSILASPIEPYMKDRVNDIKGRERWRPLAPAILEERMPDWFLNPYPSPFMTLNFQFKNGVKQRVPSVVHADGSARVQSVPKNSRAKRYRRLIEEFEKLTGVPMLLNTSFNERGVPIVCAPKHAVASFVNTALDFLAIGDFLVSKKRE
ncbi:MAG: carbamoyltransferase [Candidatus Coatesbacteria bacterium]|nr:MAG: carbamoyltransferase [Candidatus Coatesbacteria bacterium]